MEGRAAEVGGVRVPSEGKQFLDAHSRVMVTALEKRLRFVPRVTSPLLSPHSPNAQAQQPRQPSKPMALANRTRLPRSAVAPC